ncbi:amidohydrolase family protein [Pacificimonas sp. ICDLI1SI03]
MFRIAATLAACVLATPGLAQTYTIHAGSLISDAAEAPRGPSTITVTDGRIAAIADGLQPAPAGATLVDLSALTVMPGLIDSHVHLEGDHDTKYEQGFIDTDEYGVTVGLKNARRSLDAGMTTVRDLGSAPQTMFAVRRAIDEGLHEGPRILASGPAISIIGGHGDMSKARPEILTAMTGHNTCTGAMECSERVRQFSRAGADVIKITATGGVLSQQGRGLEAHFTDEEMRAIASTAGSLGLKVAAHAHGARGIEAAARAGITSIEHGTFVDEAGIEAMKENGTWYVPTLMAYRGIEEQLGTGIYTPVVEDKIRQTMEYVGKGLNAAYRAGVPIAFGTDSGVYAHGRNNEEAAMMVERGGMPPRAVLVAATKGAADLLGIADETGTLEAGKSADLIAVEGNPVEDIRALDRIRYVMARGREHTIGE